MKKTLCVTWFLLVWPSLASAGLIGYRFDIVPNNTLISVERGGSIGVVFETTPDLLLSFPSGGFQANYEGIRAGGVLDGQPLLSIATPVISTSQAVNNATGEVIDVLSVAFESVGDLHVSLQLSTAGDVGNRLFPDFPQLTAPSAVDIEPLILGFEQLIVTDNQTGMNVLSGRISAWKSVSVPEPHSLALLAAGLFGLALRHRLSAYTAPSAFGRTRASWRVGWLVSLTL